jgi:hypothetical protein
MSKMENTKEIKAHIEKSLLAELREAVTLVELNGYNTETCTQLRFLQKDLQEYNAVTGFFNAWHSEGYITKGM